MKALLIGEARGSQEDLIKHGFVGTSGQELARMCGEASLCKPFIVPCRFCHKQVTFGRCPECGVFNKVSNLDMVRFWAKTKEESEIGITNVFHEHPVKDNIELFFGRKSSGDDICLDLPPYKRGSSNFYVLKQYRHYVEALWAEIESLRPNLLIPLGNTACWAVFAQSGINKLRGTIRITISPSGYKALPTYHPAAMLRSWDMRNTIVADLTKAAKESCSEAITRPKRWIYDKATLDEIKQFFSKPCPRYSCDIESGHALFTDEEKKLM